MHIKQARLSFTTLYTHYAGQPANRSHQLVIQGFKSYKDQTVTDPFSPGHNVIGV